MSGSGVSSVWVGIALRRKTIHLPSLTFPYILTGFVYFICFPIRALKYGVLVLQLPSPPTDDEGDFIFIHHEDVRLSQKADEVYAQLIKLLKDQHEVTVLSLLEMFYLFIFISLVFVSIIILSLFLWSLLFFS